MSLLAATVALLVGASCAHTGSEASVSAPAQSRIGVGDEAGDWSLHGEDDRTSELSAETRQLIEEVYTGEVDLDDVGERIDAALEETPHAAELHEVAALMAMVNGKRHEYWYHWMEALTDPTAPLARLYLWMLSSQDLVRPQRDQLVRLLRKLRESHPDPNLRAYATRVLSDQHHTLGRFEKADALVESLGWVGDWQYIGPFDAGSDPLTTSLRPEQTVDLEATYEGVHGETSFRALPSLDANGEVALDSHLSPRDDKVAYLVTWVKLDEERTVDVRFTTDSPLRLFVNGKKVSTIWDTEGRSFDNAVVRAPMPAGWNRLRVKTVGGDSWQVGVRLTTPSGEALGDAVSTSSEPRDANSEIDASQVETIRTPIEFQNIEPRARRLFWQSRQAARTGPYDREEPQTKKYYELDKSNPLALYVAYLSEPGDFPGAEDRERIRKLVSETDQGASGLLWRRGRNRRSNNEYRRALSDFRRAIDREPTNRVAWLWLSFVQDDLDWEIERCHTLQDALNRWNSGWVHYALAECYRDRGRKNLAVEQFRRGLARRPGRSSDLEELRELTRDRGNYDRAAHYGQQLVDGNPVVTFHRLKLGEIELARGDYERAESLYRSTIEQRPGWKRPYREMAELEMIRGRRSEATEWLQKASERATDDEGLDARLAYHRTLTGERDSVATERRVIEAGRLIDRRKSSEPLELGDFEEWLPEDSRIRKAVEAAPDLESPEDSRWIHAMDDEVTLVRDDGTAKRVITQVHHPITDKGRDELVREDLPDRGKVEILKAHTVTPEGERLEARSIRDDKIRFRGVEKGATTVVQYIHHLDPHRVMDDHYFTSWWFRQPWGFTRRARWVVISPEHKNYGFKIHGDAIEHRTETTAGRTVHVFESEDVPPVRPEPKAIERAKFTDHVYLTTLEEWDTYVDWEMDRLPDSLDSSDALAERARALAEDHDSARGKLHALAHWVQQEIRYEQDYEDRIARLIPHAASKIFDRKYGDCKDKAVVFIQMADTLGLDVDYALLRTRNAGSIVREVPGMYFNHAIAYVPAQEGLREGFFVDLTSENVGPDLLPAQSQGNTALVIDPDDGDYEFRDIPYEKASDQYEKDFIEIHVDDPEEVSATWELRAEGYSASRLRSFTNRLSPKQLGRGVMNRFFPGASVTDIEVGNFENRRQPVQMVIDAELAGALKETDEGLSLSLPRIFGLHKLATLDSRRMPLNLGTRQTTRMTLQFKLGDGVDIASLPDEVEVDDDCFSWRRTVERDGQTATVDMQVEISCATVSPDQYDSFRSAARRAAQKNEGTVEFTFE